MFFFFKQKTAYELRISDWSSDVCSSDLQGSDGVRRNGRSAVGCKRVFHRGTGWSPTYTRWTNHTLMLRSSMRTEAIEEQTRLLDQLQARAGQRAPDGTRAAFVAFIPAYYEIASLDILRLDRKIVGLGTRMSDRVYFGG